MHLIKKTKITDYLLNLDHPEGAPKAKFFLRAGFSLEYLGEFESALLAHPHTAALVARARHVDGEKLTYECVLRTPNGPFCIRSVWVAERDGATRLITAYPFQ